ncbi:MAG TPA: hypothetical protein VHL77_12340 [Ferruginibacter sp.]|jgi:hypothetical protein|nr:hypothetical protein [Ferruginibacter sp.]
MKQKFFMLLCLVMLSAVSFAQVTVDVFINGTKAGQIVLNAKQTTGGLSYKKSVYRNIDKLSIQISGKWVDGGYYRKVLVLGDDVKTPMLEAPETVGAVGQFVLTNDEIIKRLKKGKPISLWVEKTPANTKSKEAVTKIFLGTLSREK